MSNKKAVGVFTPFIDMPTRPLEVTYEEARLLCEYRQQNIDKRLDESVGILRDLVSSVSNNNLFETKRLALIRIDEVARRIKELVELREIIPVPNYNSWED